MKKAIVAVGVVAIAALVMVLFLPGLLYPPGTNADLTVTFFDKDGNQVGLPLGFIGPSGPVDSVTIVASYTVTSTSERFEENLEVWGNLLIEWRVVNGAWTTAYDLPVTKSRAATGSWTFDYNLRDIIAVDEAGKTSGWEIRMTVKLTSRTTMSEGEVVTSDPSTAIKLISVGWETDDLIITAYVGA